MAKTLEDFIKDYLSDRSVALGAKGYAKWISERGYAPAVQKNEAAARAELAYRTSLSGYGKNAERLSNAGLRDGGYAKYLDELAKQRKQGAADTAALNAGKSAAKEMKAYEGYLDKVEQEREKLYSGAVKSIRSDKLTSFNAALKMALSLGLDEQSAKKAATEATDAVKAELHQKLLGEIATKRMTSEVTRAYALTIGLDEQVADELAQYAHKLNESTGSEGMTESYLEYLKNLLKKG
jgi:hypothetical protein